MNFLPIDSMFRVLNNKSPEVEVELDGKPLGLRSGISLAAALIESGCVPTRYSPVRNSPRAPYCMMGSCFECLIQVDGVNQRACQIMVKAGMQLKRCGIDDAPVVES